MKSKMLKFVMPVFAFILAIGLAFATGTEDDSRTGYYLDPSTGTVKDIEVDCNLTSPDLCEFEGNQVFAEESLKTPLRKTIQ